MSKKLTVAVVGATGAVGREMLKTLHDRQFPATEVRAFASARSAGTKVPFGDDELVVQELKEDVFEGIDIAIFSAGGSTSEKFAPHAAHAGCVVVDNSSQWRMDDRCPLVVPEVNPEHLEGHQGIIANPNRSTITTAMAVGALNRLSPIESMVACTYQAVSGAGQGGLEELEHQMDALARGEKCEAKVFPTQIALNVIPFIGSMLDNLYTDEEMKMQNEGRKILHLPELRVTCTCVRVPVMRSHSIAVTVRTKEKISVERARELIAAAPGCKLVDDLKNKQYPMPLDTSDQDIVFVGRIRPDLTDDNGLCLWCCGDQVRKGAATNAIQIAELLVKE